MFNARRFFTISVFAIGVSAIAGCATSTQVPDSKRITTKEFDGNYRFEASNMARRQNAANQNFNCPDKSRAESVNVRDGVMTTVHAGVTYQANVDVSGNFRLEIPSGYGYNRLGGTSLPGNEITWVYAGTLGDPGKGRYTSGKKSLNNLGCNAPFPINKL